MVNLDANLGTMFRRKPNIVQAMQWDGTQAGAGNIFYWIEQINANPEKLKFLETNETELKQYPLLKVLSRTGVTFARKDDWIIWSSDMGLYPATPNEFEIGYEILVPPSLGV